MNNKMLTVSYKAAPFIEKSMKVTKHQLVPGLKYCIYH